jgi:hypothetical protein
MRKRGVDQMTKTALTYSNALASVASHAEHGVTANFKALASGTMAFMLGQTWSDKDSKVPTDQIKSDILAQFRDSGDKKSKAYEFGALALTIAKDLSKGSFVKSQSDGVVNQQWEGNPWALELREVVQHSGASLEDGVDLLAARFHSVADSVSALARYFKGAEKEKKVKAVDFMDGLDKLCEKTLESGGMVPAAAGIQFLIPMGVSTVDANGIISRLVASWDSAALAHLMEHLNGAMMQRLAKETAATNAAESVDLAIAA